MLIPVITERKCNQLDRNILALPVRFSGLGLRNPSLEARRELDCKTVVFFSKSVKKSVKRGVRVLRGRRARSARARRACEAREKKPQFSASFQTFCLTARAYLNTQKYGLLCSLGANTLRMSK